MNECGANPSGNSGFGCELPEGHSGQHQVSTFTGGLIRWGGSFAVDAIRLRAKAWQRTYGDPGPTSTYVAADRMALLTEVERLQIENARLKAENVSLRELLEVKSSRWSGSPSSLSTYLGDSE